MMAELTDIQQCRIDFLLYEWETIESFAEALANVESSLEIHRFAENYNWNDGFEPLKLILNHPLCDLGTALEIYWLGQPDYYGGFASENDIPSYNRDAYLFLKFIESLIFHDYFQHNNIQFDPIANLSTEQRHYIAKYSEIPEKLLLPNYGNLEENRERLKFYREQPDDLETLDFLAHKYLKNRDYTKAIKCAENLLLLDSKSQRNWQIQVSILKEIEKRYGSQSIVIQNTRIGNYQNIHQVRQRLVECYKKIIQIYEENVDDLASPESVRKRIIKTQTNIASVYFRDGNYDRAIEVFKIVLAQAKTEPLLEVDFDNIALSLAKAYRELKDYDEALYYIDLFLSEVPEFGYLYFHKLIILKLMGQLQAADNLLTRMLETLDKKIQKKQDRDLLEACYFFQKSTLLAEYGEDFQGAADSLQRIIDLKLYYNDRDKHEKLLLEIDALRSKAKNTAEDR